MPDDEFVLAELELGDQETLRARAAELVRAYEENPGASGRYEAADQTGAIWATVDRAARLVDVRISPEWTNRLAEDRFPDALFAAYLTATRTALLVESSGQEPPRVTPPLFEPTPAGLSEEEWEYRTRALLAATEDQLAAVGRGATAPPVTDALHGRYGYLTLHVRAGGPAGITAEPGSLRYADTERLRQDALDVFAQAGFAALAATDDDTDGDFGFEY
jgi:hypothetical protein